MKNADKIRAMGTEEMAKTLIELLASTSEDCPFPKFREEYLESDEYGNLPCYDDEKWCVFCLKRWLESEVE